MFPIRQNNSLLNLQSFRRVVIEETKKRVIKKVNQYYLLKKLGYGSTSKVYLSQNSITKSFYAAKLVHLSEQQHSENGTLGLDREIRIMRLLDHPSIIKLHEVLYAKQVDTAYLFIEYANLGTLENQISENVFLSDENLATIFKQIIDGLVYLHSQGIVHHDVKPANIMLFSKGQAKLADFGIGHSFQSLEHVIGTPAYQAPELFAEEPEEDPCKEDVWSLGISLYEAAFGYIPFTGNNLYEIIHNIETTPLIFPENHNRSPSLVDAIQKMLRITQKNRISMQELLNHPFFQSAKETFQIPAQTKISPQIDLSSTINYISAIVCDENYSFKKENRSFSWPRSLASNKSREDLSSILYSKES